MIPTYMDWLNELSERDWHEHIAGRLEYPYSIGVSPCPSVKWPLVAIAAMVIIFIISRYF